MNFIILFIVISGPMYLYLGISEQNMGMLIWGLLVCAEICYSIYWTIVTPKAIRDAALQEAKQKEMERKEKRRLKKEAKKAKKEAEYKKIKEQYIASRSVEKVQTAAPRRTKSWWQHQQPRYAAKFCRILGTKEPVKGIYKITNKITGEVYIGQSKNIYERWMQHCRKCYGTEKDKFAIAIRYYGLENFSFEVKEICSTKDALDAREKYWIAYYDSYNKGYNSTAGNV